MSDESSLLQQAEAWYAKLDVTRASNSDLRAFRAWRAEPRNLAAWDAMLAARRKIDRFVVRPQTERFKVVDIWTGETAVIAMTPQDGMSEDDAVHTARMLNRRAEGGDRSVLQ
jgi:hypothetical protein